MSKDPQHEQEAVQPSLRMLAIKRVFELMEPAEQLATVQLLSPQFEFVIVDYDGMHTLSCPEHMKSEVAMNYHSGTITNASCTTEIQNEICQILEPTLNDCTVLYRQSEKSAQKWLYNMLTLNNEPPPPLFAKEIPSIITKVEKHKVLILYFDKV